jgi:para-nitrobenzyl esterase
MSPKILAIGVLVVLMLVTVSGLLVPQVTEQRQTYFIPPKDTDSEITTNLEPHYVALNKSVPARNQLFLFFPGTGGKPHLYQQIINTAADLGLHAIALNYPNDRAVNGPTLCGGTNTDLDCYAKVRLEIKDGTDRTPLVTITRANSIENRLIKLLVYLHARFPNDGWRQYLEDDLTIKWSSIVVSGHSQGGGHAGIIGRYHLVARVVMFAAMDYNARVGRPANWIALPSSTPNATPPERFYGFSHQRDQGVNFAILSTQIWPAYGMDAFGPMVNVDDTAPPYHNSHMLTSNLEAPTRNYHNCIVVDQYLTLLPDGTPVYKPVWEYLLGTIPQRVDAAIQDSFIPHEVRLGDPTVRYANIEFSPDGRYAVWFEPPHQLGQPAVVWHCGVNLDTGDLIPPDCKGFRAWETMSYNGRGAPGRDSRGVYYIGSDLSHRLIIVRPTSPTSGTVEWLPNPPDPHRQAITPAWDADLVFWRYTVYEDGKPSARELRVISLADPTNEIVIDRQKISISGNAPMDISVPHWYRPGPFLSYGFSDEAGRIQLYEVDLSSGVPRRTVATTDPVNKIDAYPFIYNGARYIVAGLDGTKDLGIYRYPSDGGSYERIETISIAQSSLREPFAAQSPEPLIFDGKGYVSFFVKDRADRVPKPTGEIWLATFEQTPPRQWRLSAVDERVKEEPEPLVGNSKAWVFYTAHPTPGTQGDRYQLWRADTPLVKQIWSESQSCPSDENVVATEKGCVRGESVGAVKIFRGIPYAAPPVGNLRWKAPQEHPSWDGVREATQFGKSCPQLPGTIFRYQLETDEDCLSLNIWTPKIDPNAKLPVMVWIHGGGLVQGSSSQKVNDRVTYDGRVFAERFGVVVVTINYRLAQLGFLAHPALSAEDIEHNVSGNYGLLDQIFALRWVQKNIQNFGGDPQNVTIFGESGGGKSVCALLASPLAAGLFQRAIIQSGGCPSNLRKLRDSSGRESAEAQGERFARAIGCADAPDVLACLRSKSVQEILQTLPGEASILSTAEKWDFTVDGYALPQSPGRALEAGNFNVVPVIAGTTGNEASIFTGKLNITTAAQYEAFVRAFFRENANQVLALYPVTDYPTPKAALDALISDISFVCPTRRFVRDISKSQQKTFLYHFTYVTRAGAQLGLGAFHGSEIPFVFGNLTNPTPQERALSDAMMRYWVNFAKTGDPNDGALPTWLAYTLAEDPHLQLDVPIKADRALRKRYCDFFDQLQAP